MSSLRRRTFFKLSTLGAASLAVSRAAFAEDEPQQPTTYTYKTVGEASIKADVHGAVSGKKRSVIVWIHGGALIMGSRFGIDRTLLRALIEAGYVVVSIDYRLAPETKLPAILEDVRD